MRFSIESRRCDVEARERLKRYLEQRRELGERELVLDGMTVEDVMKIVGATGVSAGGARSDAAARAETPRPPASEPPRKPEAGDPAGEWRDALRASGADPATPERPARKSARPSESRSAASSDASADVSMASPTPGRPPETAPPSSPASGRY